MNRLFACRLGVVGVRGASTLALAGRHRLLLGAGSRAGVWPAPVPVFGSRLFSSDKKEEDVDDDAFGGAEAKDGRVVDPTKVKLPKMDNFIDMEARKMALKPRDPDAPPPSTSVKVIEAARTGFDYTFVTMAFVVTGFVFVNLWDFFVGGMDALKNKDKAFKKVRIHRGVTAAIGTPITMHNSTRLPHKIYDKDRVKYLAFTFRIDGPRGSAKVHVQMRKAMFRALEWHYLIVVPAGDRPPIHIIDRRAEGDTALGENSPQMNLAADTYTDKPTQG